MTREEAIEHIKNIKIFAITDGYYTDEAIEALAMATRSLEAWGKVKKEMDETISTCESNTMRSTWCDGELAGFLQSKDIIDRNLSEVSE